MKYSVIPIALLVMHCAFGESSHNHEDHYVGHQHSPEHDMDLLLGTEVVISLYHLNNIPFQSYLLSHHFYNLGF